MRLKSSIFDGAKHTDTVVSLAWSDSEYVFSAGDDHVLMKWNFLTNEAMKVATLPEDLFPTALHWFPKPTSSGKKHSSELLLAASADGKLHFLNKNGRFDRSIEAHQGAVLVALWSYDGAGLLTGGEDGLVKVWSRSGMLRSTVVSGDVPVYAAAWGPDSNHVLIAQSSSLLLKPLAPNSKPNRWRAHEGLILKVSWNQSNNLIVSGGEDCRYKVWDALGHVLYTSSQSEHPITSVAWAPGGDLFAVASFNSLRLCDRVGWSHSLDKVPTCTIYDLAWSPDGTQLAGACGNGNLIFAHVIDRRLEWKNIEVCLTLRETMTVRNVLNETEEKLEFGERVAKMALGFDHLVVTTLSQCHIYSTSNWNTPIITTLKDGPVTIICLSYRIFLLVERTNINIYSYDGKLQSTPKLAGLHMETLDECCLSLAPDLLAIVDQSDEKMLRAFDLSGSRQVTELQPITHAQNIMQVAASQTGPAGDREVAFLDRNRDVYLWMPRLRGSPRPVKLSTMMQAIAWSSDAALLAGVRDATLNVWCCPSALRVDKHLVRRTTLTRDLSELGKSLSLVSFVGNSVSLKRLDGSNVSQAIPPYAAVLLDFASNSKWEDGLRLCRFVNEELLWACLACLACMGKDLETAEEAYAAINELDKVTYIQYIKALSEPAAKSAHLALLAGNATEAENILLHNGLLFAAIMLLVDTYDWSRALDLAVKHRTHVDTVLYKRKLYLETFEKEETNEKYLQFMKEVELDVDAIKEKIANESTEKTIK